MDKFRALTAFIQVVESNSFAKAAKELNLSPPSITRAVNLLEEEIGTRLLVRTTRALSLTESGRHFFSDARRILSELEAAEAAARGYHAEAQGELRITAPVMFGRLVITPLLGEFLNAQPRVTAQTLFVDRNVDLLEEGLDVGIRIGHLTDSSQIARLCGYVRRICVATPGYLKDHGIPSSPDQLGKHQIIQSTSVSSSENWEFAVGGKSKPVRIVPAVAMNTNDSVIDLCARGFGIAGVLSYQVANQVENGTLVEVLEEFSVSPLPVHIIHHEGRTVSGKVRAFVDFAHERLRDHKSLMQ